MIALEGAEREGLFIEIRHLVEVAHHHADMALQIGGARIAEPRLRNIQQPVHHWLLKFSGRRRKPRKNSERSRTAPASSTA